MLFGNTDRDTSGLNTQHSYRGTKAPSFLRSSYFFWYSSVLILTSKTLTIFCLTRGCL